MHETLYNLILQVKWGIVIIKQREFHHSLEMKKVLLYVIT